MAVEAGAQAPVEPSMLEAQQRRSLAQLLGSKVPSQSQQPRAK